MEENINGLTDLLKVLSQEKVEISLLNDNLKLRYDGELSKELVDELRLKKKELIQYLTKYSKSKDYEDIMPVPKQEDYELSHSQRQMWAINKLESDISGYNVYMVLECDFDFDLQAMEYAVNKIIDRYEILRTVFKVNAVNEPRQVILPSNEFGFSVNHLDFRNRSEEVYEEVKKLVVKKMDLEAGPLFEISIINIDDGKSIFVYVTNHIISDETSLKIFLNEFSSIYQSYRSKKAIEFPALKFQYKDFASWQNELINNDSLNSHKTFWKNQLSGEIPKLKLLGNSIEVISNSIAGNSVLKKIGNDVLKKLKEGSIVKHETLFMKFLASLYVLFYKYTNQTDIIIGTPVSGRDHADLNNQIGYFINTLPLRLIFSEHNTFREIMEDVKKNVIESFQHKDYPYLKMKEEIVSGGELINVMISYHNQNEVSSKHITDPINESQKENFKLYSKLKTKLTSTHDLTFHIYEHQDDLSFNLEYKSNIFSVSTINHMLVHLESLMDSLLTSPDTSIGEIEYLGPEERETLLHDFNDTVSEYQKDSSLVELFEEQAAKTPDNVALVYKGERLTYGELDLLSNQFAHYLVSRYTTGSDVLIGVKLDRSVEMLVSILGILKSGSAYVPIDTGYPQERIAYMLKDSGCEVLIDSDVYLGFKAERTSFSELSLNVSINSSDLCYVIYTSGSTGRPKGVMIEHGSVIRLVKNSNYVPLNSSTVLLSTGSVSFDATTFEYWGPLLNGGQLVLCSESTLLDGGLLQGLILERGVNTMWFSSGLLNLYIDTKLGLFSDLSFVIAGGDKLSKFHIEKLLREYPDLVLYNGYGPTENTTFSTCHKITETDLSKPTIPIGSPISNSTAYILGAGNGLQPIGVVGEIYLGGSGLARGYLNNDALTSEKFIAHHFNGGDRLYKTGDLGRWLDDGTIEFVGREDDQVKIRGYRIELGEIESVVQGYTGVSSCVVLARGVSAGDKELVCYVIGDGVDVGEIRSYLQGFLPDYMIPGYFVLLDAMPLNSNGKVDKKSLPDPDGASITDGIDYVAPGNEIEKKLVEIWSEVLEIPKEEISVKSNFFELGGHSLKIVKLYGIIYKEFEVKVDIEQLFDLPSLESLALCIGGEAVVDYQEIPQAPSAESYVLSSSQRSMWVLCQIKSANVAYNMPMIHMIEDIDPGALERAFTSLISRHESLRTVFRELDGGDVRQIINPEFDFKLVTEDLEGMSPEEQHSKVNSFSYLPFDLSVGPLLRVGLYRISEGRHVFVYVMHHIISDELSLDILFKELMFFYEGYHQGGSPSLQPLRLQYKDYSVWQQQELLSGSLSASATFWRDQFSGEIPVLDLATDYIRPLIKTYSGGTVSHRLDGSMTSNLRSFLEEKGCTMFMGVLSLVNTLLYKYTGDRDIILGSPISGRDHVDLEGQIGFYINMLALRTRFENTDSFSDLLEKVKEMTVGAYSHQLYPLDELVDGLSLTRDTSRHPLFDVMVSYHVQEKLTAEKGHPEDREGDAAIEDFNAYFSHTISKSDLMFYIVDNGVDLDIAIEYSDDLFARATIDRMLVHFESLIASLLATPDTSIGEIAYLGEEESDKLLHDFNDTQTVYPRDKTIVELFEEQAEKVPNNVAVVFKGEKLTYRELDVLSNQFAHYLGSHYTTGSDVLIGLKLDRSLEMLVSILGILKSGSAYVPIDPEYPQDRIDYMLSDSGCEVLIDSDAYAGFKAEHSSISDLSLEVFIDSSDLCYVIYTSGSTGRPKGVMIEHRSVIRLVKNNDFISLLPQDNILSLSPFVFDGSIFDIFGSLLNGSSLIVPNRDEVLDFTKLNSLIEKEKVSVFFITTALFNTLVDSTFFSLDTVRSIMFGGELVSVPHVKKFKNTYSTIDLLHVYGPTENTTFSTYHRVLEADLSKSTIPIGIPISNSTAYILDDTNRLVPIGVVGEICLGGDGLARGYLNNAELTSEKFIDHPFEDGEHLYKTGDLGRWLDDGTIEFVGREDDQVKIRGHRIELGEIESVVQGYAGVSSCVVLAKELSAGDKEIVSYVVGDALDVGEIRSYLQGILPGYMIPGYFVLLDAIPLNANGKVDKKSLPDPDGAFITSGVAYQAPRNPIEKKLVEIWSTVLDIPKEEISVKSNFFELGGHSLKVVKLYGIIYKEFEVKVDIEQLFDLPSLESQAKCIEGESTVDYQEIPQAPLSESYVLSSSQRRLWVLSQFDSANIAYNVPMVHVIEDIDIEALDHAFTSLISRHESLRTVFREVDGEDVRQFINPGFDFKLVKEDLEGVSSEDQHSRVKSFCYSPFDLAVGPLLRGALYRISEGRHVFVYVMHHIISDELSLKVLFKELMFFYDGYHQGNSRSLPALRIHYKDYSVWQQQELLSGSLSTSASYWKNQFRGDVPVLDLATDYVRPLFKTYSGGFVIHRLEGSLVSDFRSLIEDKGCTMFMGVLSLVNVLLHKYSGDQDIILGSPISGRDHIDLEGQIGFYVNTLSLRTRFEESDNFSDLLGKVKEVALGAYSHQLYPFDELVDELSLPRDTSRHPLFDVVVSYRVEEKVAEERDSQQDQGASSTEKDYDTDFTYATSKSDLLFSIVDKGVDLDIGIEYSSDLFTRATIQRMLVHLEYLMSSLIDAPEVSIKDINYLSAEERERLLNDFNDTNKEYPKESNLVNMFESQVEKSTDAIALVFEDSSLTYGKLDSLSNLFAHYLVSRYSTGSDVLIGVKLDRSMEMLVVILGILKSGSAYVPIDPEYPQERIDYMLSDSGCEVLIDSDEYSTFRAEQSSYNDSNLGLSIDASDLCYVIYTSGSTGRPKGVMIEHGGIINTILSQIEIFDIDNCSRTLQFASLSFDASVSEIFITLLAGKELYIAGAKERSSPEALEDFIIQNNIDIATLPPAYLQFMNIDKLKSMQYLITAGESPIYDKVCSYLKNGTYFNAYGPTEASICATILRVEKGTQLPNKNIPIGSPISNSTVYILDEHKGLQLIGVVGDIYLGGVGLARGYLNMPKLTEEKFIPNPFKEGERLYKTGDIGRWLDDGTIDFVGRQDDQVKIRGYRIELGEIENVVQDYAGASSCVVLAKELSAGDKDLVCYIVGDALDIGELRRYMRGVLPSFMIPTYFVLLDAMPLTSNGKVDKKSLPNPDGLIIETGVNYVAPRNELEENLVEIWSDILGIPKEEIGVKSNFFDLGGNSFKIIRLLKRINKVFGYELTIVVLFRYPTIALFSNSINSTDSLQGLELLLDDAVDVFNENIALMNNNENEG